MSAHVYSVVFFRLAGFLLDFSGIWVFHSLLRYFLRQLNNIVCWFFCEFLLCSKISTREKKKGMRFSYLFVLISFLEAPYHFQFFRQLSRTLPFWVYTLSSKRNCVCQINPFQLTSSSFPNMIDSFRVNSTNLCWQFSAFSTIVTGFFWKGRKLGECINDEIIPS